MICIRLYVQYAEIFKISFIQKKLRRISFTLLNNVSKYGLKCLLKSDIVKIMLLFGILGQSYLLRAYYRSKCFSGRQSSSSFDSALTSLSNLLSSFSFFSLSNVFWVLLYSMMYFHLFSDKES